MKKILMFLFLFLICSSSVSAASTCSYKEQTELNQKASNVKVTYETKEAELEFDDGVAIRYLVNVSILNLTNEFYAIVTNDHNNEEKIYTYKSVINDVITFEWDELDEVTNFTITLYTTDETSCADEKIKTIRLTTPRYNEYSKRAICTEKTDFYLCQQFVITNDVDEDTFLKKIREYNNSNNNNENYDDIIQQNQKTIIDYLNEYKWFIVGGISIIVVIGLTIYGIKRKKQRDLGL